MSKARKRGRQYAKKQKKLQQKLKQQQELASMSNIARAHHEFVQSLTSKYQEQQNSRFEFFAIE